MNIESELNKIITTTDDDGIRAARACLSMLNFVQTFAGLIAESGSEPNQRLANELNSQIRQAALCQLVTDEILQKAVNPRRHTILSGLGD